MRHLKNFKSFLIKESLSDNLSAHKELMELAEKNKDSDDMSYFQAILDYGYNRWQDKEHPISTYSEMIDFIKDDLGEVYALIILLGKYNQQVTNNGHSGYHGNGYDSIGRSGAFSNDSDECELHTMMIELFKKFDFDKLANGKEVLSILEDYSLSEAVCDNCDGAGEIEDECYSCDGSGEIEIEGDEEVTCDECNGTGRTEDSCDYCNGTGLDDDSFEIDNVEELDSRYYTVNDVFTNAVNKKAESLIKSMNLKRKINDIIE